MISSPVLLRPTGEPTECQLRSNLSLREKLPEAVVTYSRQTSSSHKCNRNDLLF